MKLSTVADKLLVSPIKYIIRRLGYRDDVFRYLQQASVKDSAEYYLANMANALRFRDRYALMLVALKTAPAQGLVLEFGSYQGKSLRYLGPRIEGAIHGFDSFEGLQEDWAGVSPKGTFDVGGKLPKVPPNVVLHKGWFQDTLPVFLAANPGPIRFLHLDADTYESTAYVLGECEDRIVPGTVIEFDEYFGYPGWRANEYKAFQEFIARTGRSYRYIGFGWMSVAVVMTS